MIASQPFRHISEVFLIVAVCIAIFEFSSSGHGNVSTIGVSNISPTAAKFTSKANVNFAPASSFFPPELSNPSHKKEDKRPRDGGRPCPLDAVSHVSGCQGGGRRSCG